MTNNKFSMPDFNSDPRILKSPLVAGEITHKLEASHVPNVPSCHGLPRIVPRIESDDWLPEEKALPLHTGGEGGWWGRELC